jgi:hypothetical protein
VSKKNQLKAARLASQGWERKNDRIMECSFSLVPKGRTLREYDNFAPKSYGKRNDRGAPFGIGFAKSKEGPSRATICE